MAVTPIQIKFRVGNPGAPPALFEGELAYNQPDTNSPTVPGDVLYVGDGVNVNTLVGATRQVELRGNQTITGIKTIDISGLKITGGGQGYLLQTDGTGNLTWTNAPGGGLTQVAVDGVTISGDGTTLHPLAVITDTVAVKTDGVTIGGTGVTANPLTAIKWPMVTDGITIAGTGLTGSPLHTVGGATAVVSDGTTITGTGTTASPLVAVRQTGPVATTGSTLTGNGTTGSPLAVAPNTVPVATNATLTGNGTTGTPLGVVANSVPVATNATLTGNGTTGSPLGVVANSVAVATDGTTISGNGTTASPLAAIKWNIVTDGTSITGNGITTALSAGSVMLNGDVTGTAKPGATLTTTLATVMSSPGTYNSVTVNGKGLVTAASNVAISTYGTTAPSSPVTGALWWNPTANILQMWSGTAWVTIVPTPVVTSVTLTGDASGTGP